MRKTNLQTITYPSWDIPCGADRIVICVSGSEACHDASSNEKRAIKRQECREALAAHICIARRKPWCDRKGLMLTIDERLGLLVAPSQVRLQPSTQDGYAWSVTKLKESILQRSLSNGTVGLYQAIQEELGRSLEAVSPKILRQGGEEHGTQPDTVSGLSNLSLPPTLLTAALQHRPSDEDTTNDSFTAIIRRLERENHDLRAQLDRARVESDQARQHHRDWEAEASRLAKHNEIARVSERRLKSQVSRMQRAVSGAVRPLEDHTLKGTPQVPQEE